jgi:hypothetical protein
MALVIPAEDAAKPPPQRKQRSNGDVWPRPPIAKHERTNVRDRPTRPAIVEWNRPDVVQRHIAKERVTAQVKASKVPRINAHWTLFI